MKQIIIFFLIIFINVNCNEVVVEYIPYSTSSLLIDTTNNAFRVIDCIIVNKKDRNSSKYASQYICYEEGNIERKVKIISTCIHFNFKPGSYVLISECNFFTGDTLLVASDKKNKKKYEDLPLYLGTIAIPIE